MKIAPLEWCELIELVTDKQILSDKKIWNIPSNLFFSLKEKHVISNAEFIPSSQRVVIDMYNNLSGGGKNVFNKVINNVESNYNSLNQDERIKVSDTLIKYFYYMSIQEPKNIGFFKRHKNFWLRKRINEPQKKASIFLDKNISPPTEGHKPSIFKMGFDVNDFTRSRFNIGLAVSHHDKLSNPKGRIKDTEFTALDIELGIDNKNLELSKFTLIKLTKFITDISDLNGNTLFSWGIDIGVPR